VEVLVIGEQHHLREVRDRTTGRQLNYVFMKKLALILFATMLSCSQDEQIPIPLLDCDCNRVVEVFTMNVVTGNGGVAKMYKYTTINDCSEIQRESGWSTQSVSVGQCK